MTLLVASCRSLAITAFLASTDRSVTSAPKLGTTDALLNEGPRCRDSPRHLVSIVISSCAFLTADSLSPLQVGAVRVRGCFGPLRSSDHDAALDRVSSPSPVLKAFAPPPGISYLGTSRLPGLGRVYPSVSFEISLSSYGCGPPRSWTSTVVEGSRSNGTWEGRSIERRLEDFPDVTLGQLPLPVLSLFRKFALLRFRAS